LSYQQTQLRKHPSPSESKLCGGVGVASLMEKGSRETLYSFKEILVLKHREDYLEGLEDQAFARSRRIEPARGETT